jgi:hypothetical protein
MPMGPSWALAPWSFGLGRQGTPMATNQTIRPKPRHLLPDRDDSAGG